MSGFEIALAVFAGTFYLLGAVVTGCLLAFDPMGRPGQSEPPAWFVGLVWPMVAVYLVFVAMSDRGH